MAENIEKSKDGDVLIDYCHNRTQHETLQEVFSRAYTADFEPVTRCKNCLHWQQRFDGAHYCRVFDWVNGENDFCSFAERRTDAHMD